MVDGRIFEFFEVACFGVVVVVRSSFFFKVVVYYVSRLLWYRGLVVE